MQIIKYEELQPFTINMKNYFLFALKKIFLLFIEKEGESIITLKEIPMMISIDNFEKQYYKDFIFDKRFIEKSVIRDTVKYL